MGCCQGSKFAHRLQSHSVYGNCKLQTGNAVSGMFSDGGGGEGGRGDMYSSDLQL